MMQHQNKRKGVKIEQAQGIKQTTIVGRRS